jgi:hypothetical protein
MLMEIILGIPITSNKLENNRMNTYLIIQILMIQMKVHTPYPGADEICFDGIDNDGDGFIDCDDFDCNGNPDCD